MFAPARKKPSTKNEKQTIARKPVFNNNRLRIVNKEINKHSSLRNFEPFVYNQSSSGKNSFQYSRMGSQENYEVYLNEEEDKESMKNVFNRNIDIAQIDQDMRQILESIRKQKTEISMKIMKMKAQAIENRKNQLVSPSPTKKIEVSTSTHSQKSIPSKVEQVNSECQTDQNLCGEKFSNFIEQKLNILGLSDLSIPASLLQKHINFQFSDAIEMNKALISMLLNLMDGED